MSTYLINLESDDLLKIGFNAEKPAQNDQIVKDASARLEAMAASGELKGGAVLRINGAASLPAAFAIAHKVGHLYGAVGVFDPKLQKYVIAISHNPDYPLGALID